MPDVTVIEGTAPHPHPRVLEAEFLRPAAVEGEIAPVDAPRRDAPNPSRRANLHVG